jgi:hypothetical protein
VGVCATAIAATAIRDTAKKLEKSLRAIMKEIPVSDVIKTSD